MGKPSFARHRNLTFASLLVGYAGYYLCRQNLSVAGPLMEKSLHLDHADIGNILSFGTFTYALGKFTTGAIADTRGGRFAFFTGLVLAVLASLLFGVSGGLVAFFAFWGLNTYVQSMGWGGLVNVMSRWFPKRQYGTAMGAMSISYQGGAALAVLLAGALIGRGFGWQALFFVPAGVLTAIGLVTWQFLRGSPADVGLELPLDPGSAPAVEEPESTYLSRFKLVLSDRMFLVMCGLSFVLTLLRQCFQNWTPTYFDDLGAGSAGAAFKSAIFPILGCVGTLFAGWFSDRFLEGRRGPVMAVMLAGTVVALLALVYLQPISLLLGVERLDLACVLIGVTGFFLLGSYSLVGGVVALDFGGRRTAGTAAGLLDGVGYLGATLAGRGVAEAVKGLGWGGAYAIMAATAAGGIVLCGFLWKVKPR
jgi:sugar phosphate permease